MENLDVHEYLQSLLEKGKSEDEIRAAIEGRMPPGCRLEVTSESCVTPGGTSGYRRCGRITNCNDPSDNTDWTCGGCMGS